MPVGPIESTFRAKRDAGRKLLVPYVTGGLGRDWLDVVRAVAEAGADAVEVGVPFSDPSMDGVTIQAASTRALAEGATPDTVLAGLAQLVGRGHGVQATQAGHGVQATQAGRGVQATQAGRGVQATQAGRGVPLVAMTYANVVYRPGPVQFARHLANAGVAGAIIPDLPLDELDEWGPAAEAAGVETILLAAPSTPDDRLAAICARSQGWVYGVAVMGVTGERQTLGADAATMGARLKAITDKPVLLGVGVSTPQQAAEVAATADGVIVGSAVVRRLLEGAGPDGAAEFVAQLRAALD